MSLIKIEDKSKWVNAFIIVCAIFMVYISARFFYQLSDWFDLEARLFGGSGKFTYFAQGGGLLVGIGTYLLLRYRKSVMQHLDEVYTELVKVIWPDRDSTFKVTIGIMIAVAIISGILVFVDFVVNKGLNLIYGQ
ncbi:MAG: preprotein translocase subunit SecE [Bacteriovoracaceae bacterium]|nr:preprotein translocase subunit SecE [Bacteriovoracaceae bacterium]